MKVDFAFVILHYNTLEDTILCVDSIKKNVNSTYNIVIVDNCSPNGSGKLIKEKYCNDVDIHVILSERNEGFARGNNIGFLFAKEKLHPKYIILMNNDTKLLNNSFCSLVENEYSKSHCAIIGPKVITPNPPFDSNPGDNNLPSVLSMIIFEFKIIVYYLLSYLKIDDTIHKKYGTQEKNRIKKNEKFIDNRVENVKLHGCFWVFTPEYIRRYDGLNPKTFLYQEEPLLFLRCIKNGLKTVYLPDLQIFHKEDSSTNSISFSGEEKRRRFVYKNLIKSGWVLICELIKFK